MGQSKPIKPQRSVPLPEAEYSSIQKLIAENFQLRLTAVELALQTAILRERLSGERLPEQRQLKN